MPKCAERFLSGMEPEEGSRRTLPAALVLQPRERGLRYIDVQYLSLMDALRTQMDPGRWPARLDGGRR